MTFGVASFAPERREGANDATRDTNKLYVCVCVCVCVGGGGVTVGSKSSDEASSHNVQFFRGLVHFQW